ncbi:MAG: TerB family tellurite resistance protein [Pseudomonadales bacterium]|jgi:uncharacterized tellurite resistance protein B-like protein|nr:TerB family tellurite resistance protein [Pseudomonadales bacterium]MDP6472355.1 TerB family tellurite resistance protein [Pseudomonadales bacterium]MDP6828151.1 TerB family tellurite resistance protein [Pseudomonadales bacterium]MDP6973464.1 TerB family tellurite resistance protein [Pseudomonadales bacterium]|tara:strand:+ start:999 stop:1439 length:441 start_codon:yes stop_codon:yes gene_type:complete
MSLVNLGAVLKIFGGGEPTPEEKAELCKEVMLMTLARATSADTNVKAIEVDTVRQVLKDHTGEDFSSADVRVVAYSELYEKAPLDRYLASAGRKLDVDQRVEIIEALAEIMKADERVSSLEITFFNTVAEALRLTPAQLAGLKEEE